MVSLGRYRKFLSSSEVLWRSKVQSPTLTPHPEARSQGQMKVVVREPGVGVGEMLAKIQTRGLEVGKAAVGWGAQGGQGGHSAGPPRPPHPYPAEMGASQKASKRYIAPSHSSYCSHVLAATWVETQVVITVPSLARRGASVAGSRICAQE